MDFWRVLEVKGRDGSMANRSGVENEEYAKFGPECGIPGRKREETLSWNLALRMADDIDNSASSQPSKADSNKFWYQAEILSQFLKNSDCFLDMTGICRMTSQNLLKAWRNRIKHYTPQNRSTESGRGVEGHD